MATPILAEKGIELHTFFNVETIDPERKVVQSLEGEELPYDLLILVPPHKGQPVPHRLAGSPGARGLAADRPGDAPGRRPPHIYALGDATDLPLSKAGSTAHFEAPVVAERVAAAVVGRDPAASTASYTGKVMCFFEVGDGKGTLLQFDYEHPPKPPRPNQLLAPGQDRLQQDLLAHRAEGPRLGHPGLGRGRSGRVQGVGPGPGHRRRPPRLQVRRRRVPRRRLSSRRAPEER